MEKYLSIFKISYRQEFAYKVSFFMWRLRSVIQIIITYFLWTTVFSDPKTELFGYNRDKILTYVFLVIIFRALVFSSKSQDVAGEISDGNLSNFLSKPVSLFKYWFTRDLSSKLLNLAFSVVEFTVFFLIFRPIFFIPDITAIILSICGLLVANYLIFILRFLVNSITFWVPEMAWGGQFLFMVIITEFLSGSVFPIDIFPETYQKIIYLTPFPYLIFFPMQIILNKLPLSSILQGFTISILWTLTLAYALKIIWLRGLKNYASEGR